jgi:predicted TIM-barrel fold metal-dependent hydrolase
MFGSDYPHPEGVAEPVDYAKRLEGLSDEQIRMIMRDNAAKLYGIAV